MKRSLTFLAAVLLFYPEVCNAFFLATDTPEEIRIEHTTSVSSTQGNNTYHFYDNDFYKEQDYLLAEQQSEFLAFDTVDIDIPLNLLTRQPVSPQQAIDRILASNMRIRQIMQEFELLRARAREMMLKERRINSIQNSDRTAKMDDQIAKDDFDIRKRRLVLKTRQVTDAGNAPKTRINSDVTVSNTYYYAAVPKDQEGQSKKVDLSRLPGDDPIFASGKTGYANPNYSTGKSQKELSWIFRVLLSIWHYIVNNRVELFLYSLIFLIVGFFITLKVRK